MRWSEICVEVDAATCNLVITLKKKKHYKSFSICTITRVGNFIIGASGSDKQMLYGSSVARAAPTKLAVNKIQKG